MKPSVQLPAFAFATNHVAFKLLDGEALIADNDVWQCD